MPSAAPPLPVLALRFPDAMPNMALTDNSKRGQHYKRNGEIAAAEREAWGFRLKDYAVRQRAAAWFAAHPGPYRLRWTVSYRDRRVRDWDNLAACFKPAQDALVDAGYLPADDARVLVGGGVDVLLGQSEAGIVLEIEEISA